MHNVGPAKTEEPRTGYSWINTGGMQWTEYAPVQDICRYLSTSQKLSTLSTETRVHWPIPHVHIYFAYKNKGISQLKRRTLRTIWGWNRAVFLPLRSRIFFQWCCLMSSLISIKKCGYRVDQGQIYSKPINLSQQEKLKIFWHANSCLLTTLPLWHTTTKMYWK